MRVPRSVFRVIMSPRATTTNAHRNQTPTAKEASDAYKRGQKWERFPIDENSEMEQANASQPREDGKWGREWVWEPDSGKFNSDPRPRQCTTDNSPGAKLDPTFPTLDRVSAKTQCPTAGSESSDASPRKLNGGARESAIDLLKRQRNKITGVWTSLPCPIATPGITGTLVMFSHYHSACLIDFACRDAPRQSLRCICKADCIASSAK